MPWVCQEASVDIKKGEVLYTHFKYKINYLRKIWGFLSFKRGMIILAQPGSQRSCEDQKRWQLGKHFEN